MITKQVHVCVNCSNKTTNDLRYKDKQYCDKCYRKCVEYESDSLRRRYDVRDADPRNLTWYQLSQRRVLEDAEYLDNISWSAVEEDLGPNWESFRQ